MDDQLTCLTLYPEWAHAIAHLGKRVENRDWKADSLPGKWIGIHAGAYIGGRSGQVARGEGLIAVRGEALRSGWRDFWVDKFDENDVHAYREDEFGLSTVTRLHTRAIVCAARVSRFERVDYSNTPERERPAWSVGPILWHLDKVVTLDAPVPVQRGMPGLWKAGPSESRAVWKAIHAATGERGAP